MEELETVPESEKELDGELETEAVMVCEPEPETVELVEVVADTEKEVVDVEDPL